MLMPFEIVVIGVSLGGLKTLQVLLGGIAPNFMLPLVIVQHRNMQSGGALTTHLQKHCSVTVREPDDKDLILASQVYIAPAGYHLMVQKDSFSLSTDAPVCYATPSIDVLFESAADSFGAYTIGVLLSGANDDGVRGLRKIKAYGGHVVAQDPSTAECPTMPQAAILSGVVDKVLPLTEIAAYLATFNSIPRPTHANQH